MQLFYVPDINNKLCLLDKTESHHCIRVLRMKNGDVIECVDGKGGWYKAEITVADPKAVKAKILEERRGEDRRDYRLHMVIAPTKNMDRFEFFAEKATEIGVDEITPVLCEHSERKKLRIDRLEKVVISAMKQSLKSYLPLINDLVPLEKFIRTHDKNSRKFIAHCVDSEKSYLIDKAVEGNDFTILIGPEGDFSDEEIRLALDEGFIPVSLGESRLRTETAGIVACQIIASRMSLKKRRQEI